jgi:hypothetical protein
MNLVRQVAVVGNTTVSAIELPSGALLNPLSVKTVSRNRHFWGDKFYLTFHMRGQADIDVEGLTADEAEALLKRAQGAIGDALSSAQAYDEAYDAGRSDGYDDGRRAGRSDGYSDGYQEAKDAFWTHDREEYRIDEYNVGFEAGKRQGREDGDSDGWSRGYAYGKEEIEESIKELLNDAKDEVVDAIMFKYPLETTFSFRQIEMSLDLLARSIRRRLAEK